MSAIRKGKQRGGRVLLAVSLALAALAVALLGFWMLSARTASELKGYAAEEEGSPWLDIDWVALLKRNPDVTAWVHVPGTEVSYPIVQASDDAPARWLHRDIDGNWSSHGSVYADADCDGARGPVALVFGHHMVDGSMLSAMSRYTDVSFRKKHKRIYVQTPGEVGYVLEVQAAHVVSGASSVPVAFATVSEESEWLESQTGDASVPSCEWVFCTCSYTGAYPGNERTLTFAAPERVAQLDGAEELSSDEAVRMSAGAAASASAQPDELFEQRKAAEEAAAQAAAAQAAAAEEEDDEEGR